MAKEEMKTKEAQIAERADRLAAAGMSPSDARKIAEKKAKAGSSVEKKGGLK